MTVTAEQLAAAVEQCKQDRIDAGLPPMIDDERSLGMLAAVIASSERRQNQPDELAS